MVGVGARNKYSSTVIVTTQQDTPMETDASTAPEVPVRPPMLTPTAAKAKMINVPVIVEEAGFTIFVRLMLKGHTGGHATNWEQWANSYTDQFKCISQTMAQSLRIREDLYIKMFAEKENVTKNHRLALEKINQLEKEVDETNVTIETEKKTSDSNDSHKKLENENNFIKNKLKVVEEKLKPL